MSVSPPYPSTALYCNQMFTILSLSCSLSLSLFPFFRYSQASPVLFFTTTTWERTLRSAFTCMPKWLEDDWMYLFRSFPNYWVCNILTVNLFSAAKALVSGAQHVLDECGKERGKSKPPAAPCNANDTQKQDFIGCKRRTFMVVMQFIKHEGTIKDCGGLEPQRNK